jgi:putative peptidoglycan lipid II flippase
LICTVTFPLVARALAAGDLTAARDRVEKDLGQATAVVLLGTACLMACAPALVSLLFERGAFGPHDTAATAAVMRVYGLGLPAQALVGVMVRPYFSVRPVVRRADEPRADQSARSRAPGLRGLRALGSGGAADRHRRLRRALSAPGSVTLLDWYPVAAMALGLLVTIAVATLATPHIGAPGIAAGNAAGITTTAALLLRGLPLRGIALRLPAVLGGQARLLAAAVGAAAAGTAAGKLTADPLPATLLGGGCAVLVFAALGTALKAAEVRGPVLALVRALQPPPAAEGKPPHGR